MKISAIEKICKEAKEIRLFVVDGVQWLSAGYGCYPLFGMPRMTAEQLCGMFDIPEDKRGKYRLDDNVEAPTRYYSFEDYDKDERPLCQSAISVVVDDVVLVPCKTDVGLMWIQPRLFLPFSSLKTDAGEGVTYHVRKTPSGSPYVAVKMGISLVGLVMPYAIPEGGAQAENIRTFASWIGGLGV